MRKESGLDDLAPAVEACLVERIRLGFKRKQSERRPRDNLACRKAAHGQKA